MEAIQSRLNLSSFLKGKIESFDTRLKMEEAEEIDWQGETMDDPTCCGAL
jgi:hypothetical protein